MNTFPSNALRMDKISRLQVLHGEDIDTDFYRHVSELVFNSDASLLAVISKNNLITIFNLRTKKIKDIIHSHVKLYHKRKNFYDKTMCFVDNNTLLTLSDNGIFSWKISKYDNDNLNYLSPKFFTTFTFDPSDKRLYGVSNLYVGDSWGYISQLDINDGRIVRTIYQFEDEIINKMAISEVELYLAVITYTSSQQYKLYILIDKYTKIAYQKILPTLPDALYFSPGNMLILSSKYYDFEYQISESSNKLKLTSLSQEPKPKAEKLLPTIIPEKNY